LNTPQTDGTFVQDFRRYRVLIERRRGLIVACLGVSLIIATLYNYTARPMYQATAQILIDRMSPKVLPIKELVDGASADFATEYQLLRGRVLIEKVVAKLDLQKSQELQTGATISPWERFQRRFLGKVPPPVVDSDGIPMPPAVAAVRSRITVEPLPGGRLVNIRFNAYQPVFAAQVANALAETYIEQSVNMHYATTSEATEFLSDQVREQKRKLEETEAALQEFRRKHGLVTSDDKDGVAGDKIQTLDGAVMSSRMQRIAKETQYNQLRSLPPLQLATSAAAMANPSVQDARQKLADLQAEQARLGDSLGEKHPDMVRIRNEVRNAEEKLRVECQNFLRSLQNEYQLAANQEASLSANLAGARRESLDSNTMMVEYGVLKREVESNRHLYESLAGRAKETGLETEIKSTNVRIVERAEVPNGPFLPQRAKNYQLALLIGLALGIGLTLFIEHLDNTVKTPEDVKEQLGLPFLGMVPDVSLKATAGAPAPRISPVILRNQQSSAEAEAYRVLRTNLIFSSVDSTGRVLLVTSANPGEGKTTTVANLAASLALNGAKVLAVDADLRRPAMHTYFGIGKTPGLSDVIVGKCPVAQAIQTTRLKGLHILPCGYIPPNPAELLGSASMRQWVEELRSRYDWVLIDTPPVLGMADTPVLCPLVEGVILVVAAEVSKRPAVQRAVDQLLAIGGKVTGVVLNRVNLERNSYYYGQYYGEYYRSYYGEGSSKKNVPEAAPLREVRPGPRPIRRSPR
jgi:polysaccharide biosynthesis transport protein